MNWISELINMSGDEEIAIEALSRSGFSASKDANNAGIWLLTHQKYEKLSSALEVYEDTKILLARLCEIVELEGLALTADAGSVRLVNPDGTIRRFHFASVSASCAKLEMHANCTVTYDPGISVEERLRRQQELAAREAARERPAAIARVTAALADPTVIQITRLVRASRLTMTEAGHIVDIVQDAMNGDLSSLTTKKELSRFRQSINHPAVMGLGARHAKTKVHPPSEPMAEDEAREYATRIGLHWLSRFDREA